MTIPPETLNSKFAADNGLALCSCCEQLNPISLGFCPRCGTRLHLRKPHSLRLTLALIISATALYFPAMMLPVMDIHGVGTPLLGTDSGGATIISGVITFWQTKSYPVAIVIFTASILIPILKISALLWLCYMARRRHCGNPRAHAIAYHITDLIGRWSMVDIFVVAIMVCLVRLGFLLTITPGPAAISFAAVVILTMFAAMSFDPRLLWDQYRRSLCQ